MKKIMLFLILGNLLFSETWYPYRGFMNGNYHLGFGTHFWDDHIVFRNMQFRLDFDLAPGIRFHSLLRSNTEFEGLNVWEPNIDEGYLEGYFFRENAFGKLSANLKVGEMRYLRFPEPDIISQFDQVPGTEDLRFDNIDTSYRGELLTIDYKTKYNLGYHFSGINWDFDKRTGSDVIENFIYYKNSFDFFDFEARFGSLQLRHPIGPASVRNEGHYQLGRSGEGFDIYLGGTFSDYKVGFLYEEIYDDKFDYNDVRTGVLVRFGESTVTEALGAIRFDYTRAPQGMGAHITVAEGEIGYSKEKNLNIYELVGEVEALRVITYWQNGQGRNFYEHMVSKWGNTDSNLLVIPEIKPWYLTIESLVSPHTEFSTKEDLIVWEAHRQGPAELNQKVTYKYYKLKE